MASKLRIMNNSIKNLLCLSINYNYNFLASTEYSRFLYEEEKDKKHEVVKIYDVRFKFNNALQL